MGSEYRYSSRPASILRRSGIQTRPSDGHGGRPSGLDWPAWLALIERKRRLFQRNQNLNPAPLPAQYFVLATHSSFALEGIELTAEQVQDSISHGPAQRKFRSRAAQRVRNHVAILHGIENALRVGEPLKTSAVVRWYTSISSGLSTAGLGAAVMTRLENIARRINSPQLRLQPALQEIVQTHADLLSDPLLPSFNGILSRLLLRYHLGRCALPFVVFDPAARVSDVSPETALTLRLLVGIDESYDLLLK
jgi:hypothetical protein